MTRTVVIVFSNGDTIYEDGWQCGQCSANGKARHRWEALHVATAHLLAKHFGKQS